MEMILQINELKLEVESLENKLKTVRDEYKEYKNAMGVLYGV